MLRTNLAGLSLLISTMAAFADVGVTTERVKDRKGKPTTWTAVSLDSGRTVCQIRFNGKQVGLGPNQANWYHNGFLAVTIGKTKTTESEGSMEVVERGPDRGIVRVRWPTGPGSVTAHFELRDGDDKLLLTIGLPKEENRHVELLCYPSSYAGGYHKGKEIRKRHALTAKSGTDLANGDHSNSLPLGLDAPWALFMDDHFDVAKREDKRLGPCAVLCNPNETKTATIRVTNYACYLRLWPKPDVDAVHLVLWDFQGMSNGASIDYMKSIEVDYEGTVEPE